MKCKFPITDCSRYNMTWHKKQSNNHDEFNYSCVIEITHYYSIFPFQTYQRLPMILFLIKVGSPISILWKHKKISKIWIGRFVEMYILSNFALKLIQLIILTKNRFCIKLREHSSITSWKRWVGGVRKCQFLMIYSTVDHQRGGWA